MNFKSVKMDKLNILVIAVCVGLASGQIDRDFWYERDNDVSASDPSAYEAYIKQLYPMFKENPDLDITDPYIASNAIMISTACQKDLQVFLDELYSPPVDWSNIMADSYGRPEAGRWSGNYMYEGRSEQCKRVYGNGTGSDGKQYRGRHCVYGYPRTPGKKDEYAYYGMCLPSSCDFEDVPGVVLAMIKEAMLPSLAPYNQSNAYSYCENYEQTVLSDPSAVIATVVLFVFALLLIVGTVTEATVMARECKRETNTNNNATHPSQNDTVPGQMEGDTSTNQTVPTETEGEPNNGGVLTHRKPTTNDDFEMKVRVDPAVVVEPDTATEESTKGTENHPEVNHQDGVQSPRSEPVSPKPNVCVDLLLCFSVYKNARDVASVDYPRGSIHCIHGIRFLAMCWIVLGHTWTIGVTITDAPTVENILEIYRPTVYKPIHEAIDEMNLSVETFLVLSAMLTTMSLLNRIKKSDNKPTCAMFGLYYFHRFWRLTPVYMFLLMIYAAYTSHMRTMPLYPPYQASSEDCKYTWWLSLLYVQNLFNTGCMGWSWYMAVDFQFYVMAPLFIWLLWKKPIAGYVVTALGMAGSIAIMAYLQYGVRVRRDTEWFYTVYSKPWTRSATYFLGIFLGYLMFMKNRKIHMNRIALFFGWLVSALFILISIYPATFLSQGGHGSVVYYSIRRPLFALAVCWIILACTSGYAGVVNSILSWRVWVPLSRLTYTGYLIHPMIMYYTYYSSPVQINITYWVMVNYFLSHLVLTLGASFVATLTFEVPFLLLEKVMFRNVRTS